MADKISSHRLDFSVTREDGAASTAVLLAAARMGTLPLAPYPPIPSTPGYVTGPAGALLPPPPDEAAITAKADRQLAAVDHLKLDWRFWLGLGSGALGLYWLARGRQ